MNRQSQQHPHTISHCVWVFTIHLTDVRNNPIRDPAPTTEWRGFNRRPGRGSIGKTACAVSPGQLRSVPQRQETLPDTAPAPHGRSRNKVEAGGREELGPPKACVNMRGKSGKT